jgi:hypothetical protein
MGREKRKRRPIEAVEGVNRGRRTIGNFFSKNFSKEKKSLADREIFFGFSNCFTERPEQNSQPGR